MQVPFSSHSHPWYAHCKWPVRGSMRPSDSGAKRWGQLWPQEDAKSEHLPPSDPPQRRLVASPVDEAPPLLLVAIFPQHQVASKEGDLQVEEKGARMRDTSESHSLMWSISADPPLPCEARLGRGPVPRPPGTIASTNRTCRRRARPPAHRAQQQQGKQLTCGRPPLRGTRRRTRVLSICTSSGGRCFTESSYGRSGVSWCSHGTYRCKGEEAGTKAALWGRLPADPRAPEAAMKTTGRSVSPRNFMMCLEHPHGTGNRTFFKTEFRKTRQMVRHAWFGVQNPTFHQQDVVLINKRETQGGNPALSSCSRLLGRQARPLECPVLGKKKRVWVGRVLRQKGTVSTLRLLITQKWLYVEREVDQVNSSNKDLGSWTQQLFGAILVMSARP